jgi:hypothetical protein
MTSGIFVLLMVWATGSSHGGVFVVQQEFNSRETCELARVALAAAHAENGSATLRAQGCFKK